MTCDCCQKDRAFPPFLRFDPACLWCGARYIKRVRALKTWPKQDRTDWASQVLADWLALGHSEAEIRRLVAETEVPREPINVVPEVQPKAPKAKRK